MPIQEAPLRIFRTFICIKRIPPLPPFLCCLHRPLPFSFLNCCLSSRRPFPSSIRYLKALPLSVPLPLFSAQRRAFAFIYPSKPFLIVTFNPFPPPFFHHTLLIYSLCFFKELKCFFYTRISLLRS